MIKIKSFLLFLFFVITNAHGEISSCDFKGLSIGDKIDIPSAMKKLGVEKYKLNPKRATFEESQPLMEQYGMLGAAEIEDNKIGNYCDFDSCRITEAFVGDNIPASLFISFDKNSKIIKAIEVTINQTYWNDLVLIIKNKYKGQWVKEVSPIYISNYKTKKGLSLDAEVYSLKTPAKNLKTGDACELSAIQHDIIFEHPSMRLGLYHSVFGIHLISSNF
jgi:hypothetical protein